MERTLRSIKALADPTRLRVIVLLEHEELSVNELQEITRLGQSRISTHLRHLQESQIVQSRREGKRTFYRLREDMDDLKRQFIRLASSGVKEMEGYASDRVNLARILSRRKEKAQLLFSQIAGRFDRNYGPGRSWQAFGQMLLRMLPALDVADLGSGEGLLSELFALRARKVIAVDNSSRIVAFGAEKAKENGITNLEFRLGDLENPPIAPGSMDLAVMSQSLHHAANPSNALRATAQILRPGGQIMILDLLQHNFQQARELYGDRWLGFPESDLHHWLEQAGFEKIEVAVVAGEESPPFFQTVLAVGRKPADGKAV